MFDISLFFTAVGLAVVLESCLYALFPSFMRNLLAQIAREPAAHLRLTGCGGLVLGLVIVWLARA